MSDPTASAAAAAPVVPVQTAEPSVDVGESFAPATPNPSVAPSPNSSATPAPSASTAPAPLHTQVATHLEAIYQLTKDASTQAATVTATHETVLQELHDHLAAFEQNVANTLAKLRAAL